MSVHWTPRAVKDLEDLPPEIASRIEQAVARLAATGRGDVKRLSGVWPPE
jgi:mRNA-degrading endonuclease RelE of RelBE toxin-antitoxin system